LYYQYYQRQRFLVYNFIGFVTRLTRRVSLVEQELLTRSGSRGGRTRRAPPLKLEKIIFFCVKSWFFTRNTSKIFAPPSARRNFFMCAPLTWNPGSAPAYPPGASEFTSGFYVAQSLVFCVMFCRSLFVIFSFFFWPLCCLSFFDLRILINPLVSSSSSYNVFIRSNSHNTVVAYWTQEKPSSICFTRFWYILQI
jgi:hypothetical protein